MLVDDGNPPWINRPWVVEEKTREQKLGALLNCVKCDTKAPKDNEDRLHNES